jgi:hypothetical protein
LQLTLPLFHVATLKVTLSLLRFRYFVHFQKSRIHFIEQHSAHHLCAPLPVSRLLTAPIPEQKSTLKNGRNIFRISSPPISQMAGES